MPMRPDSQAPIAPHCRKVFRPPPRNPYQESASPPSSRNKRWTNDKRKRIREGVLHGQERPVRHGLRALQGSRKAAKTKVELVGMLNEKYQFVISRIAEKRANTLKEDLGLI